MSHAPRIFWLFAIPIVLAVSLIDRRLLYVLPVLAVLSWLYRWSLRRYAKSKR